MLNNTIVALVLAVFFAFWGVGKLIPLIAKHDHYKPRNDFDNTHYNLTWRA